MWKGIAITAICLMNVGIAKYTGSVVLFTMFFSMFAIFIITVSD